METFNGQKYLEFYECENRNSKEHSACPVDVKELYYNFLLHIVLNESELVHMLLLIS